ncbi:MAG TPA: hypothetical protein VF209_04055, partial [Patescibacteria group bacterium]
FSWMFTSVGLILTSIAGYHYWFLRQKTESTPTHTEATLLAPQAQTPTAAEGDVQGVTTLVETADARAEIVANFLERYDSPLQPYDYFGHKLVEIADRYNLDFRLLPAIAMQESNLCKKAPEGTHNCLGFGIHERGTLGFDSYEAAFERAARELKAYYVDIGLTTPEEIMTKYTPSSNGSWAASVNQWMAEMRYDDRASGKALKQDADVLEFTKPEP